MRIVNPRHVAVLCKCFFSGRLVDAARVVPDLLIAALRNPLLLSLVIFGNVWNMGGRNSISLVFPFLQQKHIRFQDSIIIDHHHFFISLGSFVAMSSQLRRVVYKSLSQSRRRLATTIATRNGWKRAAIAEGWTIGGANHATAVVAVVVNSRSLSYLEQPQEPQEEENTNVNNDNNTFEEQETRIRNLKRSTLDNMHGILDKSGPDLLLDWKRQLRKIRKQADQHHRKKRLTNRSFESTEQLSSVVGVNPSFLQDDAIANDFSKGKPKSSSSLMELLDQPLFLQDQINTVPPPAPDKNNIEYEEDGDLSMDLAPFQGSLLDLLNDDDDDDNNDHHDPRDQAVVDNVSLGASFEKLFPDESPPDTMMRVEEEEEITSVGVSEEAEEEDDLLPFSSEMADDQLHKHDDEDTDPPLTTTTPIQSRNDSEEASVGPLLMQLLNEDTLGQTASTAQSSTTTSLVEMFDGMEGDLGASSSANPDSEPMHNSFMSYLADDSHDLNDFLDAHDNVLEADASPQPKEESDRDHNVPYPKLMEHGLAFLASMSTRQWTKHDNTTTNEQQPEDGETHQEISGDVIEEVLLDDLGEVDFETLQGNDNESVSEDRPELQELELLLQQILSGQVELTTKDYNVLLLNLATTTAYKQGDALQMMMQVYDAMEETRRLTMTNEEALADTTTHKIVVAALQQRGRAPRTAMDLLKKVPGRDVADWDDAMVVEAMACFEKCGSLADCEAMLETATEQHGPQVPLRACLCLLRVYRTQNKQEEALELLDRCLIVSDHKKRHLRYLHCLTFFCWQENETRDYKAMDEMFKTLIAWPAVLGGGRQKIDKSVLLKKILDRVMELGSWQGSGWYTPGFGVWNQLICELAKTPASRSTVHAALTTLLERNERYWPSVPVLRHGLVAAKDSQDSRLAIELLERAQNVQQHMDTLLGRIVVPNSNEQTEGNQAAEARSQIPPQAFKIALDACIVSGDGSGIRTVLSLTNQYEQEYPQATMMGLYGYAMNGLAKLGDADGARQTFQDMLTKGLKPR